MHTYVLIESGCIVIQFNTTADYITYIIQYAVDNIKEYSRGIYLNRWGLLIHISLSQLVDHELS